jgi:hypothetical protein
MRFLCNLSCVSLAIFSCASLAYSTVILSEDFENGSLDPRISVQTVGDFNVAPGIQKITNFGNTKAFGFGLSNCPVNCFFDHVSSLIIDLPASTLVSDISFKEMELFDNWGSGGGVFVDGQPLTPNTSPPGFLSYNDFGRMPYNDRIADTTFRTRTFSVNRPVTQITLSVADITNLSEIFIDDLQVTSGAASVPEPGTSGIILCAIAIASITKITSRLRH